MAPSTFGKSWLKLVPEDLETRILPKASKLLPGKKKKKRVPIKFTFLQEKFESSLPFYQPLTQGLPSP